MSLPQTPSFQHKHLYLINKLSSPSRPSQDFLFASSFKSFGVALASADFKCACKMINSHFFGFKSPDSE